MVIIIVITPILTDRKDCSNSWIFSFCLEFFFRGSFSRETRESSRWSFAHPTIRQHGPEALQRTLSESESSAISATDQTNPTTTTYWLPTESESISELNYEQPSHTCSYRPSWMFKKYRWKSTAAITRVQLICLTSGLKIRLWAHQLKMPNSQSICWSRVWVNAKEWQRILVIFWWKPSVFLNVYLK